MTPKFHEVQTMIDAGKRYLSGLCSIIELHGSAPDCVTAAKHFDAHPAIKAMADEWIYQIYRRWNECNDVKEPLSESAFRAWLENQLGEVA